jgi:hypothetical protein
MQIFESPLLLIVVLAKPHKCPNIKKQGTLMKMNFIHEQLKIEFK